MTHIMTKDKPAAEQLAGRTIQEKLDGVTEPGDQALLVILHGDTVEYAATDAAASSAAMKIRDEWQKKARSRQEAAKAAAAKAAEDARQARVQAERLAQEAKTAAERAEQTAKKAERLQREVNE